MNEERLDILVLVAHPDDAEIYAGGLLCAYREQGHAVKIIALTRGDAGHHEMDRASLASRRLEEGKAAAASIGATFEVWPHADGGLEPTLALRHEVIAELRRFEPDLVFTHRPCDYHPDHRAVATLVQDASYLASVPRVVPGVPLSRKPLVVAYLPDLFRRPSPMEPHVIVDVTEHVDRAVRMLAFHESQVFEWLPWNQGMEDTLPADPWERLGWLREIFCRRRIDLAERFADRIAREFGDDALRAARAGERFFEMFEISEYSDSVSATGELTEVDRGRLFPFPE